jgi:glutamate-1-semialdehyde 2,1-aminomutase
MNENIEQDRLKRLNEIIPGGSHTYSRGFDQFPSSYPKLIYKARGCTVWGSNGKKYIDYGMGLRSVTCGYSNRFINRASIRGIKSGNSFTLPSNIELEAAETLVSLIDSVEMVKFAKNGSNVTTAAIKLARAFTRKNYVCVPKEHPFFSFDDWFIGTTVINSGIPELHHKYTLKFEYGNIDSVKKLVESYKDQIAAILLEPATSNMPCNCFHKLKNTICKNTCMNFQNNFLTEVRDICTKNGIILIFDEIITGFRWNLGGAQKFFNVKPDLSTFGKAMANGFSVAALAGRREIMEQGGITQTDRERVFLLSSTNGGEVGPLSAFIATVKYYVKHDVVNYLWDYGQELKNIIEQLIQSKNLGKYVQITGHQVLMNLEFKDHQGNQSLEMKTLFLQEMEKNGVLIPWITQSFAHDNFSMNKTISAMEQSFEIYSHALKFGVQRYLDGPTIKPVFRKYT